MCVCRTYTCVYMYMRTLYMLPYMLTQTSRLTLCSKIWYKLSNDLRAVISIGDVVTA